MYNEEFTRKLTEIKEKMKTILKELHFHDAYIYNDQRFTNFDMQVKKHISDCEYIIGYYGPKNTTEEFKKQALAEYSGYLELDTNMWKEYKTYKWLGGRAVKPEPDYSKQDIKDEFVKKLVNIRTKMKEILKELHFHDAYIYGDKMFNNFDAQVKKHISDCDYIIEYYGPKNTTEAFKKEMIAEYSGYLELDTNMWNDYKRYEWKETRMGWRAVKKESNLVAEKTFDKTM